MAQVTIKVGVDSGYEWKLPATPAEVIELGVKYSDFEALRLPGSRVTGPTLEQIRDALVAAQAGHEAALASELDRAEAANRYHNAIAQATPLLKTAFDELTWKYRDTPAILERWGLQSKVGARGKVLVTRPVKEKAIAAFLQSYTAYEGGLPEADRLTNPPLATLQALAATAQANDIARQSAQHNRESGVAIRAAGAGPLLDLLQLAFGMLVVTVYDGKVMPALHDWGFNIIQTPAKPGSTPAEPPAEPTPPAA